MKRILSTILAAIFLIGIIAAFPVPTTAVEAGKGVVYTDVTSIGGVIDFAFNLTTVAWTGSQVDLILSPNGYATYDPNTDVIIKKGINLISNGKYIDGLVGSLTLTYDIIDEYVTKNGLQNDTQAVAFLKLTDYTSFIATNSFVILLQSSQYITLNGQKFSYIPNAELGSINWFNFTVNLAGTGANLTAYNVTQVIANERYGATWYTVFETQTNASQILTIDGYYWDATTIEVNGTLANFSTVVSGTETFKGQPLSYMESYLTVNGIRYNEDSLTGLLAIVSDSGVSYSSTTYTVNATKVSITGIDYGYPEPSYFRIYPSLDFLGFYDATGTVPGQLNPGDTVEIVGYNFPANELIAFVHFYYESAGNFEELVSVNVTGQYVIVAADGTFAVNATLPEAPYAQRAFFAGVETNESTTGIPTPIGTVYPYFDVYVADATGAFNDISAGGWVAPGDYLLIKGHGFATGTPVDVFENLTSAALPVLAGSNVPNSTGQFAFIGRMPYEGDTIDHNAPFYFYVNAMVNRTGFTLIADGTLAKIYINPVPFVNETTGYGVIQQSDEWVVPYQAYLNSLDPAIGWAPITLDDVTINNVELIGFPETLLVTNVTIWDGTYLYQIGTNVSLTNGYSGILDFDAPMEAIYGDYNVNVSGTNSVNFVHIRPTAALKNLDREPKIYNDIIYVAAPGDNVSIVGYGFMNDTDVGIEVYPPNSMTPAATLTVPAASIVEGSFNFTFPLTDTNGFTTGGIYTLNLYQTGSDTNITLTIYFAVSPTVAIDARVGHVHIPGEEMHVFVMPSIGNIPTALRNDYVTEIGITIFYFDGSEWKNVSYYYDNAALANVPTVNGWYAFNYTVPMDAKGDMLIKVYATSYYIHAPTLVRGEATVYIGPLSVMNDLKAMLDEALVLLNAISGDVATLQITLVDEIGSAKDEIITTMSVYYDQLSMKIDDAQSALAYMIAEVDGKVVALQAQVANVSETLAGLITSAQTVILEKIDNSTAKITGRIGDAEATITGGIDSLAALINSIADGLTLTDLKNTMTGVEATITAKIDNSTVTIIDRLGTLEATISGDVAEVKTSLGTLQTSVDDLKTTLTDLINTKAAEITTTIDAAKGAVITQITDSEGRIIAKITEVGDSLSSALDTAKSDIVSEIGSAKTSIESSIDTAKNDILGQLSTTKDSLTESINAAKKAAEEAGSNATMFGAASTILTIIVLGLLAYSIYMRKK